MKVLLENLLRFEDGVTVTSADMQCPVGWLEGPPGRARDPVPAGARADAGLHRRARGGRSRRDARRHEKLGGDPQKINPLVPVDLVIDHLVRSTSSARRAFGKNVELEYDRNGERYQFLQMGPGGVRQFPGRAAGHRHLPPGQPRVPRAGGVDQPRQNGVEVAYPDTLVGTDSHTTMINGLGVLGWGVGGIEAEAAMLGQPVSMLIPEVVGFKLTGQAQRGATATDLVLTVTQMLRKKGVVGKFVEFFGAGLDACRSPTAPPSPTWPPSTARPAASSRSTNDDRISAADRPRRRSPVALVEAYAKAQGMWRDAATPEPVFTDTLELDLGAVRAVARRAEAAAGPRAALRDVDKSLRQRASSTDFQERRKGRRARPGRGRRTSTSATATW